MEYGQEKYAQITDIKMIKKYENNEKVLRYIDDVLAISNMYHEETVGPGFVKKDYNKLISVMGIKNVVFVLNNGMHKSYKQLKAVYRKNENGNLEKIFDMDSLRLMWAMQ